MPGSHTKLKMLDTDISSSVTPNCLFGHQAVCETSTKLFGWTLHSDDTYIASIMAYNVGHSS